eukprot:Tamp_05923.p1 GENE.Tamp_05923~~Tamp_05923.p1  ORF type:complete len:342 (-),score=23.46 Tamp_05923:1209-2234(-)
MTFPERKRIVLDKLSYASMGYNRMRDLGIDGCGQWAGGAINRVRIFPVDLCNPFPTGLVFELSPERIQFIVHMAAETHVDNSIADPVPFVKNNVDSVLTILEFARTLPNLKAFFYFSTDEVFGSAPEGFVGFKEWDRHNPTNPYAASKSAAEQICLSYYNTYKTPLIIVNVMNAYGQRQHPEKFIPLAIRKILNGERLTIHTHPGTSNPGSRFYIHARNIASAVLFLLEKGTPGEKYNIRGEQEVSNLRLAELIAEEVGKPLLYDLNGEVETRPGHDVRYALDGGKLTALGWSAPVGFETSLRETVRWTLENRRWLELGIFVYSNLPEKLPASTGHLRSKL